MGTRIAICTGGGDCAGVNAAVVSATRYAVHRFGYEVIGFKRGLDGCLHEPPAMVNLIPEAIEAEFFRGGTFLETSNHGNPFKNHETREPALKAMIGNLKRLGIKKMLIVGGEGTHGMAHTLAKESGIQIVGIVKTIDNDMPLCDTSIGFSTAVANTVQALETLKTTAQSLNRFFIVETMGRYSGFLTLHAGMAAACDLIVIPERPFALPHLARKVQALLDSGKNWGIILVGEGAHEVGSEAHFTLNSTGKKVLGGISLHIATKLHEDFGLSTRNFSIGYLSRGGHPNADDRLLASEWAYHAVHRLHEGGESGVICLQDRQFRFVPYGKIPQGVHRKLEEEDHLLRFATAVGTCTQ